MDRPLQSAMMHVSRNTGPRRDTSGSMSSRGYGKHIDVSASQPGLPDPAPSGEGRAFESGRGPRQRHRPALRHQNGVEGAPQEGEDDRAHAQRNQGTLPPLTHSDPQGPPPPQRALAQDRLRRRLQGLHRARAVPPRRALQLRQISHSPRRARSRPVF